MTKLSEEYEKEIHQVFIDNCTMNMVPRCGIGPPTFTCKENVLPLNYRGNVIFIDLLV